MGDESGQDAFEDEVRDVIARSDPVPESVLSRAREAGRVGVPEGSTLLELAHDSLAERASEGAAPPLRTLTFVGDDLLVEVQLEAASSGTSISGISEPIAPRRVHLHTEHSSMPVTLERDGSFVASSIEHVPTRLVLEVDFDVSRTFHTSWFLA